VRRIAANIARLPELFGSAEARVYDGGVGPGTNALFLLMDLRFDGPDDVALSHAPRLGRQGKAAGLFL
jgi:hypothetical protein